MLEVDEFMAQWRDARDYVEAHTSGSTGKPKEIKLLKSDMIASAAATNKFFNLDASSVYVCPLSMDYIAGKMMAVRADLAGGKLCVIKPSNTFELPDGQIDLLAIVPSMVDTLSRVDDLTRVKNIIIGGASLDSRHRRWLIDNHVNAFETYGMTETCSHVALKRVTDDIFTALTGFIFSTDERQCLVIESRTMSFKRLITNDIVQLIDTESFAWLGRADNVINSGGIKLFAEQVEQDVTKLLSMPDAKGLLLSLGVNVDDLKFYVTRQPDERWGEVPILVTDAAQKVCDVITAIIKSQPDHKRLPQRVVCHEISYTSTNKIIRRPIS
jgi:O-succinylbenzoic acid--CoA ligase